MTLGVDDVERARDFYARLGWHGQEVEETVFIRSRGCVLVLWGRDKLAADCGIADDRIGNFDGVVLAQNVRDQREVDDVIASAEDAGATITRRPGPTFYGGYAGVFRDPDGHAWEIAFNPGFEFADDGSIVIPDFT